MPSVPPTYIALDSTASSILPSIDVLPDAQHTPSSPTPDPDLVDGVLVPVVTGDGVGAVTSTSGTVATLQQNDRTTEALKPHISLSNLTLHSPSSIVGTPFSASPRFEYPFPAPSDSDPGIFVPSPLLHSAVLPPFMPSTSHSHGATTFGSLPPAYLVSRSERSYSPTHPKHVHRDPPVPPGLAAKKLKGVIGVVASYTHQRKRSRSATAEHEQRSTAPKVARVQAQAPGRRSFNGIDCPEVEMRREEERGRPRQPAAEPHSDRLATTPSPTNSALSLGELSDTTLADSHLHDEYTMSREGQKVLSVLVADESLTTQSPLSLNTDDDSPAS